MRSLILGGLVTLVVATAFAANWQLSRREKQAAVEILDPTVEMVSGKAVQAKDPLQPGQSGKSAQSSPSGLPDQQDFFLDYKLERERVRSQEIETLHNLLADGSVSTKVKDKAQEQLFSLLSLMDRELVVENLIRAKGFTDAVLFLNEGTANVVVKIQKLSQAQAAQIADIVARATSIPVQKVVVMEKDDFAVPVE